MSVGRSPQVPEFGGPTAAPAIKALRRRPTTGLSRLPSKPVRRGLLVPLPLPPVAVRPAGDQGRWRAVRAGAAWHGSLPDRGGWRRRADGRHVEGRPRAAARGARPARPDPAARAERLRRMNGRRGPRGGSVLRLYPTSWRRRYEPEMLALLEDANLGARVQLDLARGALDAWFQASTRVAGPAALVGGGLWTIAGVAVVGQATPPDWPGYLVDVLAMDVAAIAFELIAIPGCLARHGDPGRTL